MSEWGDFDRALVLLRGFQVGDRVKLKKEWGYDDHVRRVTAILHHEGLFSPYSVHILWEDQEWRGFHTSWGPQALEPA